MHAIIPWLCLAIPQAAPTDLATLRLDLLLNATALSPSHVNGEASDPSLTDAATPDSPTPPMADRLRLLQERLDRLSESQAEQQAELDRLLNELRPSAGRADRFEFQRLGVWPGTPSSSVIRHYEWDGRALHDHGVLHADAEIIQRPFLPGESTIILVTPDSD